MRWKVVIGNCLDVLPRIADNTFDSIVCDPPYSLKFMGSEWDSHKTPLHFQEWCESWATEALRVLKPGGHMLAFGGARTYHRLTCGIEDAGFEIRDSIMWLYGSGFPKSLDVSKAIDKAAGAEREVVDPSRSNGRAMQPGPSAFVGHSDQRYGDAPPITSAATATPDAERWQGWGTALKPAWEPIVVVRKPLSGTVAQTVLEHGTGALNIDGCRIAGTARSFGNGTARSGGIMGESSERGEWKPIDGAGRWPANLVLSHTENCVIETGKCAQGCSVAALDAQSGELKTGSWDGKRNTQKTDTVYDAFESRTEAPRAENRGGASRFFYCAKASTRDRTVGGKVANNHPTVKPRTLMLYLVRLITPPNGVVLDPFAGSGTTGLACMIARMRFIGIEKERATAQLARQRIDLYERAVHNRNQRYYA